MTFDEFIKKAREVHGDKYDYVRWEGNLPKCRKIKIICPVHGEIEQYIPNHLKGCGCRKCGRLVCADKFKSSTEDFIKKAKEAHGDRYDYSEVNYVNNHTPVKIICKEHGIFEQVPWSHIKGCDCPKCTHQSFKHTTETFIEKARKVHGDKYDYSKVEYKTSHDNVTIICPEHGEFNQQATHHLMGKGCPRCASPRKNMSEEEIIEEFKKIHGNKYDYSELGYINYQTKVRIICKQHGPFYQTPGAHLVGQGCPICRESTLEIFTSKALREANITFERFKRFEWLGLQSFDFYLPDNNIAIECQGEQHFRPFKLYGEENLKKTVERDIRKYNLAKENSVRLLYLLPKKSVENNKVYKSIGIYTEDNTFKTIDDLIQKIREAG